MGKIVQVVLVARVIAKNAEFQGEVNATICELQAQGYMVAVQYAVNDTVYSAMIVAREDESISPALPQGSKFMLEVVSM